jgi:hypothetical protein
MFFLSIFCL